MLPTCRILVLRLYVVFEQRECQLYHSLMEYRQLYHSLMEYHSNSTSFTRILHHISNSTQRYTTRRNGHYDERRQRRTCRATTTQTYHYHRNRLDLRNLRSVLGIGLCHIWTRKRMLPRRVRRSVRSVRARSARIPIISLFMFQLRDLIRRISLTHTARKLLENQRTLEFIDMTLEHRCSSHPDGLCSVERVKYFDVRIKVLAVF